MAIALAMNVPASAQATNVSGLWSGTTLVTPCAFALSGRCNAQNKITLQLTDQNSQITGNYTCAYGTMNCRHGGADNTGTVVWSRVSGNQIRLNLMIPADVSNCYYNGMLTSATKMHGTYMCYNGGALVEEGIWDVKRASGQ
ncbi:MAG: hypothetical protein JOZ29_21000 [Deltaproteobacteria bacterium]|nr:hypothetical protein [Deltaproteobacteria bacterium]